MLESLDTAVLELDGSNCVRTMNNAAEQCFGTGRERAEGQALGRLHGVPEQLQQAVSATRGDRLRRHLRECQLAGGLYDCNIQPLPGDGILLELHDLHWEHQAQQLEQREVQTGLLELLRRNLSHEIRNPLGGIRAAAQMMAAELGETELGTLARLIMREVDRIDELIQRFGQPRIEQRKVDIHHVLDEAIDLMTVDDAVRVEIERDYDPSIPSLTGDASALRQVFINLIRNAIQAAAESIRLRTRIEHGAALLQPGQSMLARIDVEDNGEGVPEKLRALLFLPLVTGRRDGTGLGLALAQQVAAAHGGLLAYEALERGSRFSLRLPLNGPEARADDA
jgi:two-component system nitrogen regulation sensor histidine kinase GlnL